MNNDSDNENEFIDYSYFIDENLKGEEDEEEEVFF